MALLENLEIYIPLEAEVRSVPLLSLPRSVLRKMGSPDSARSSDSAHCVWISPALFQKKGQKETREGGARQYMLTVLGEGGARKSARGSSHWKMSFVTANTTAYSVLKDTLPPGPPTQPCHSPRVPQGVLSDSEQDAVIVHHGRIYLSVKRRPTRELSRAEGVRTPGGRQGLPGAAGHSSDRSQAAPQTRSQLKRKADALQDSARPRASSDPVAQGRGEGRSGSWGSTRTPATTAPEENPTTGATTPGASAAARARGDQGEEPDRPRPGPNPHKAHSSSQHPHTAHSSLQQSVGLSYSSVLGPTALSDPRPSFSALPDPHTAHSSSQLSAESLYLPPLGRTASHDSRPSLTAPPDPHTAHSSPHPPSPDPRPSFPAPPVPVWARSEPQDSDFQELETRERIAQMKRKLLTKD